MLTKDPGTERERLQPLSPHTCAEITERVLPIMNAKDDPGLDAINNQRRRFVRMLWAIAKIDDDNLLPQVGTYIGGLAVALESLIEGVTDKLFVTKGSKSKRDSKRVWAPRLQAALGVECLILGRLTRQQVKETVERHHGELRRLMRSARQSLGGSVLFWYDVFLEDRVLVKEYREAFDEMRRQLRAAKLSPAEYRRLGAQHFEQAIKTASR